MDATNKPPQASGRLRLCVILCFLLGWTVWFMVNENLTMPFPSTGKSQALPTVALQTETAKSVDQRCLDLDWNGTMDTLIGENKQIFVVFPAKAAGTTMKAFTKNCMKSNYADNVLNSRERVQSILTEDFKPQSVIASHLYRDTPLISLARHSTRQTLIVYVHREETDRLISGIRHVIAALICSSNPKMRKRPPGPDITMFRNATYCLVNESSLVDVVQARKAEIGFSTYRALTCQSYDAFEENFPNLVFLHYKQADKLQRTIAKHHCPELLEQPPVATNVANQETVKVQVQLKEGGLVKLDEWLDAKREYLEFSLNLRRDATCQGETRRMEDTLFSCPDEAMRLTL